MIKLFTLALSVSLTLWVFFYLPKHLKAGRGARFRYIVFTALALLFAAVLIKTFL